MNKRSKSVASVLLVGATIVFATESLLGTTSTEASTIPDAKAAHGEDETGLIARVTDLETRLEELELRSGLAGAKSSDTVEIEFEGLSVAEPEGVKIKAGTMDVTVRVLGRDFSEKDRVDLSLSWLEHKIGQRDGFKPDFLSFRHEGGRRTISVPRGASGIVVSGKGPTDAEVTARTVVLFDANFFNAFSLSQIAQAHGMTDTNNSRIESVPGTVLVWIPLSEFIPADAAKPGESVDARGSAVFRVRLVQGEDD